MNRGGNLFTNDLFPIVESVFSLKLKVGAWCSIVFGGFAIGSISGFTENWIFDPAVSYYFLLGLIACDHITGTSLAFRHNRWETRKAMRIFYTLVAHTALLVFATNLSRGSIALYWLNEGVFVPLVLVNMLSFVKNLSLMGLVNRQFARFFYQKVDVYKNEFIPNPKADPTGVDPVTMGNE